MNASHIEVWHCMASGDRKTACSVEWPEDGREHGATSEFGKVNCIPCFRVVIAEMRAGFKAIRRIAENEGEEAPGTDINRSPDSRPAPKEQA